ncbi:putative uncharacterized protein FLJ44672 [Trachypithecus francoisi]|uniref:putative uncharacterized protein FLJ44672 n=1 Tax=Trachypithecus francoisi TaxID=54180 RepID=UPI00141BB1B6|nr:putative uncharacterized protein FLJ44672 [Trachypithecus francoisi]
MKLFRHPSPELLLPFGSSNRPRSCLPVASLGPANSSRGTAFPGHGFASCQALEARLGPHCGLPGLGSCSPTESPGPSLPPAGFSRPSSFLPAASAGPCCPRVGLSRDRSCSRQPLQAQPVLQSASAGPARASRWPLQLPDFLRSASPGPAPPACHWPLQAQPHSRLWAAFPGPASDFWRPPRAEDLTPSPRLLPSLLPPEGRHGPSLYLTADSPRPAHASLRPPQASAPPAFR